MKRVRSQDGILEDVEDPPSLWKRWRKDHEAVAEWVSARRPIHEERTLAMCRSESPSSEDSQSSPPIYDSDSDEDRNPSTPERVQWEYHEDGWWRGMYRQDVLDRAWKDWNKKGCPKACIWGVMHHGVIYNVNFKKFNQTAHERNDNGTLKPSRRTRSIRRIMVSHERDSSRPYE